MPGMASAKMRRGDLVFVPMQGDHGKPRPALVIQSDLFDQLPTVTVLPLVSSRLDEPAITRVDIRHPGEWAARGVADRGASTIDDPPGQGKSSDRPRR